MNDNIKEVYVLAELAKRAGQDKIPVHIFPFRMTDENMKRHLQHIKKYDMMGYGTFWEDLKIGYDYFEGKGELPIIKVDTEGRYVL